MCIASWLFGTVALGQVMTRMHLGLDGRPSKRPERGRPCKVLFWATAASTILGLFSHSNLLSMLFSFYVVFLLYCVTVHVQKRYNLPGNTCQTIFQTLCCPCCLTARLVRHTADHGKYPYHICDERGLSRQAPDYDSVAEGSGRSSDLRVEDNVV